MDQNILKLVEKNQLTHDVWELVYKAKQDLGDKPGQFFLCDCECDNPKLKRAFSISWKEVNQYEFIVKREEDGKGGSKAICDQEIGHEMCISPPMGHFTLRENDNPKVFIGTGTGFAPLWYQMNVCLELFSECEIQFIFGVRNERDIFYEDKLKALAQEYKNFSYQLCLSQPSEGKESIHKGYVTDLVEKKDAEFYICGSPAMVSDARTKLENFGVEKENIFFEQY